MFYTSSSRKFVNLVGYRYRQLRPVDDCTELSRGSAWSGLAVSVALAVAPGGQIDCRVRPA
jgi:hypothetical protein